MPYHIFLALGAFMFTLLGTRLLILALRGHPSFTDVPNARSNHAQPTPRGGGIAVAAALVTFLFGGDASYWLLIGLVLLALISLLDDMISLSPLTRLLTQFFTVAIVLQSESLALFPDYLPYWAGQALAAIVWVWFINLFNFMDGIDGISATEMAGIGLGISVAAAFSDTFEATRLPVFGLILAASGIGFYWWNRSPAKIFLGDVGSIPIGFFTGYLLLSCIRDGYLYPALILPAYYISDGGYTLIRRALRGEKIWQAHSEHCYQKAVRAGRSHRFVVRMIGAMNLMLIALSVLSLLHPNLAPFFLLAAYLGAAVLMAGLCAPARRTPASRTHT